MTDRIYQSIKDGAAPRDLEPRHVQRTENFCDHPDGSFTFQIERHPHVLGQPTKGTRSSFFETEVVTYRWRAGDITVEDVTSKGFTIDDDAVKTGAARVRANFDKGIARGKVTEAERDDALGRISTGTVIADAVGGPTSS